MNEYIVILAIVAAAIGAVASTIQGYMRAEGNYSLKKLASALVSSVFFAFGIVNITNVEASLGTIGVVGVFISNALLGYGIDQAHSALDK